MWNQKDLPEPPVMSYKTHKQDLDVIKLRNALQQCIKHFKESKLLTSEAALLSRVLYRMKMKFRSSKDVKILEKLCRSIEKYFSTNMARHLKNVLDMTPTRYNTDTYLPTKNMLNYVLVRLQGLVKLMERIYDTCLIAATELHKRFYIGHFWKLFLILFGLVSRISVLVKYNAKTLCDLYGKLLPYSHKLENCGNNWLPDGYVLPTDLRSWLSVQWVYEDEFVDLTYEPADEVMNFFNLVDDDEDDVKFCDEYILLDDEEERIAKDFRNLGSLKESLSRNRMRGFSFNEDDIGEELTEVIEINDTILDSKHSKDKSERILSTIHEDEHTEDIGEELCLSISDPSLKSVDLFELESSDQSSRSTLKYRKSRSQTKVKDLVKKKSELNKVNGDTTFLFSASNCPVKESEEFAEIAFNPSKHNHLRTTKNRHIVILADKTAPEVEEDSEIIASEHGNGAENTVIVLDETIRKETSQTSNTNSKKKKKSKKKKLGNSSKENLQEVDLAEINRSKQEDIPHQTKRQAKSKRKLDFTEATNKKKIRRLNGRSLKISRTLSSSPVKGICSSNNTPLTPKLELTSTTSQGATTKNVISKPCQSSGQSSRSTSKNRKLKSQTKVKDLMKKESEFGKLDVDTTFLFSASTYPIKEEGEKFAEIVSNSPKQNQLRTIKNRNNINLSDKFALEIEEDSVIIVSGYGGGAENAVVVLDETIREETSQSSNSNSKKKKKLKKNLRSSKENLPKVDLDEINRSKEKDIPHQTKRQAVLKRKLDLTEVKNNKKIRKLNGRPLEINGTFSSPLVKDMCSSNNTLLTPQLELTSTTSQGGNSLGEIASRQSSGQNLKNTAKKKRKHKLRNQTKVDLVKKNSEFDKVDEDAFLFSASNYSIKESSGFPEIASNSPNEETTNRKKRGTYYSTKRRKTVKAKQNPPKMKKLSTGRRNPKMVCRRFRASLKR